MEVIREILKISSFEPTIGNQLHLFKLISDTSLDKKTIEDKFNKSPAQFRNTYKVLKDNLLNGLLQNSFSDLSKIKQLHITIRKKQLEAFILIQSGNKRAGITIAEEAVRMAERYGVISVALELSRDLATIYAALKHVKYLKYKEKIAYFLRLQIEETKAQSLYNSFSYIAGRNKPWEHLLPEVNALTSLLPNNSEYRFRLYYYVILNYVYSLKGEVNNMIENCETALQFFDTLDFHLPYTVKWGFLIDSVPLFIASKQYARAEKVLETAAQLPEKGSFNWHITQQVIASLGFYSNKPAIAVRAMNTAKQATKKFDSPSLEAKWNLIHAYLDLYKTAGRVNGVPTFRLYRMLNDVSALNRSVAKRNSFVLELLHLLAKEKHFEFLNRTDTIEQYISRNALGKEDNRLKYFLRMLRSIATGAFHTIRIEAHAKKNKAKLFNTPVSHDTELLDKELVPYELLWELALSFLKK